MNFIKRRINYLKEYKLKDFQNGWSGIESGPCCEKCRVDLEEVEKSGRAVALRTLVGCKDPFQIKCKCHIPFRKVAGQAQLALLEELGKELERFLVEER